MVDEKDIENEFVIDEDAFQDYLHTHEDLIQEMEGLYNSRNTFNMAAIPLLRAAAIHFEEHDCYTKAPKGTKAYRDFWIGEFRRMDKGYKVEGVEITGYNYFYLNYSPILKVTLDDDKDNEEMFDEEDDEDFAFTDEDSGERVTGFPDFWKIDYDFFWCAQIAEKGISKAKYDTLQMDVEIHPSAWKKLKTKKGREIVACRGGKGLSVTKCRGSGFSYKLASMGMRNIHTLPESRSFYYVGDKRFLEKDGILSKAWSYWRFHDTKTDGAMWKKSQKKKEVLHRVASYITEGVEKGFMSQIIGMVIDNPAKIRGGRSKLVVFEEAGSFPKLLKCWQVAKALVCQGGFWSGLRIAFGTGGDENAHAILGLENLFYKPGEYDLLPLINVWDKTKYGKPCGYFVPAFTCMQKYLDSNGFPLVREAMIDELRQRFKFGDDKTGRDNHIAEAPFSPTESFLRINNSEFPLQELLNQQNRIDSSEAIQKMIKKVDLFREEGIVKMRPSEKIEIPFPHKPEEKRDVPVVIFEEPVADQGSIPDNLYYIVHDPYMKDKAPTTLSLGATYVMKRNVDGTNADLPVAWYVGRPDIRDDYNNVLFMLADMYNAKIQSEYQGGGQDVVTYAKNNKMLHRLMKSMDIMSNAETNNKKTDSYFINLTTDSKQMGITYVSGWLKTIIGTNEFGHPIRVYDRIYDHYLLEELIRYSEDGNFDRISAMIVAQFQMRDYTARNTEIEEQNQEADKESFWNQNHFSNIEKGGGKVEIHDINTYF